MKKIDQNSLPDQNSVLSYNAGHLTADGRPWFPVMGEIHYSRLLPQHWEKALCKMKAGGVDIVSAYVIWIHHEEVEGECSFSGHLDLRAFLQTVQKCGLYCILRIGPWIHGEVRNGGFPDWMVEKEREGLFRLRTNDEAYLRYVQGFYRRISEQVQGLFLPEGGPVIGVQIENEYGHCGGLTGEEGERHMRTLRRMAEETGFNVPVYTATGWGGAVTGGMLPVMGGYCEAPWDQRVTEIEPSVNYVFTQERDDHGIGSDYGYGGTLTFDPSKYPYLTAELGGGLQVTAHRRPVATADDIAAMSMVKLGSGCSLLGYYMYHGGTNPKGKLSALQESRATGYPNDLPELSYDFNAPVREYGQLTETYRRLRMLAMFVHDYEEVLCRTQYFPQPGNPEDPGDFVSLRTAVRADRETGEGFLFVNNYQRRRVMAEHRDVSLRAFADGDVIADLGRATVRNGDYFFRPFGLRLAGGKYVLEKASATPLCVLRNAGCGERDVYVFYKEGASEPEYTVRDVQADRTALITGTEKSGPSAQADGGNARDFPLFLTLTEEEALRASKVCRDGREYLVIADGDLIQDPEGGQWLVAAAEEERHVTVRVYPAAEFASEAFVRMPDDNGFAIYRSRGKIGNPAKAKTAPCGTGAGSGREAAALCNGDSRRWKLHVSGIAEGGTETFVRIVYDGDRAGMFLGGELAADNFYTGQVWEVEVSGFAQAAKQGVPGAPDAAAQELDAEIRIEPLYEGAEVFLETLPAFREGRACAVRAVSTETVHWLRWI